MKKMTLWLMAISMIGAGNAVAGDPAVSYPDNYRQWKHIKSMVILPGHALENPFQGIHHIYANQKAQQGLKQGKYEDGAVLVFDLLQYHQQDKSMQEADRKLIGVMQRDSKLYAKTGGWGFEAFKGDSRQRLVDDAGQSCFACHTSQASKDYVFTQDRP